MDARLDALEISIFCADGALDRGGSDAEGVGSGDGTGHVLEVAAVAIKLDHGAFGERNASGDTRPRRLLAVAGLVDETGELVVGKRVHCIACCHGGRPRARCAKGEPGAMPICLRGVVGLRVSIAAGDGSG